MARPEGITFRGDNYLPDWGDPTSPFKYSYTFKVPDGLDTDEIDAIITAVGGSVVDETSKGVPCDDVDGFPWTPRKLKFWFENGKTVSIPLPNKTNLVATANQIASALRILADVVCVSLEGETWRNIIDHLTITGPAPLPTAIAISNTPPGEKEPSYVGNMYYETDGGKEIVKAFKMATNRPGNLPYAEYSSAINNCLVAGGSINTNSSSRCSGFRSRTFDHRRFTVTMLQERRVISGEGGSATSETKEAKSKMFVPMATTDPTIIRACGIALKDVPATICLGYRGEWDKRFSLKNPGALP